MRGGAAGMRPTPRRGRIVRDPRLARDDVDAIWMRAYRGEGDPLDLLALDDGHGSAAGDVSCELVAALLRGERAAFDHVGARPKGARNPDRVTASAIAHLGVSPLGALVVAEAVAATERGLMIRDGRSGPIVIDSDAEFSRGWAVRLSAEPHATWHSDGMLAVGAMPGTMAAAFAGSPLAAAASHPALDPFALMVTGVDTLAGMTTLSTAHDGAPMDDDAFAALEPRSVRTEDRP